MLVAVAAVAGAVALLFETGVVGGSGKSGTRSADNAFPTGVARVMRQQLSSQTQVSATLGYAGPSSIVVPAGTAPTSVQQSQQEVSSAEAMLQNAQATLSADTQALTQARADLSAIQAKEGIDCRGNNAAESASSGSSGSGASSSGPCASDEQLVAAGQQSVSSDTAKIASDEGQVSSNESSLNSAEQNLSTGESTGAVYGQSSTYTTLPRVGEIVRRGGTLYAISGEPVILLYGRVAAWRAFVAGMSSGRDVAELNANLRALGYGSDLSGDEFTSATAVAIDAFQTAHGLTETGQLLLGSVVFEHEPVRVTAVTPTVGATVQPGPVLSITSTARQVTIELDAAQQAEMKVGDPVVITLPDNTTTPGKVSYVGSVATTPSDSGGQGGSSAPTIEVDVTPTDPAATGRLDQAPVNVSITTASIKSALVVPVNALLALANGGYALEAIGSGGRHLVAVSVGLFDDQDGLVQVTGTGISAGQRVVVPSE